MNNKDLAYEIHNNEVKFGVPKNVFFIGMMIAATCSSGSVLVTTERYEMKEPI